MEKRTGIFYVKNPNGVVVKHEGVEIARYGSVSEFVVAHGDGIRAMAKLEEHIHQTIAEQYKDTH